MIYQYFPLPSCRMGALWALSDIEGACILEFGPAGTTHFSLEGMGNINGSPKAPKVIFVMASTLTAIIGIDLESLCMGIQPEVKAKLIPIKSDGFKGDFTYGVKEVLTLLAKEWVAPSEIKREKTYNIVGSTMDGFSSRSDVNAIQNLMKRVFGASCHVVFTSDASMERLYEAGQSALNIAMRSEAIEASEVLKASHGMPYVSEMPYGLSGIECFCKKVAEATGWAIDEGQYKALMRDLGLVIQRVKMHVQVTRPRVLVSGPKDTVVGIMHFLEECGIGEKSGLVGHRFKLKESDFNLLEGFDERKKREILEAFAPDLILGDGVTLAFAKKICPESKGIQIANPNLDRTLLHHAVPHMGAEGILYLSEHLL